MPAVAALAVVLCGWALLAVFSPKKAPGSIAAHAVECLWAGDFDCMARHITYPINWEKDMSRETMRRVYKEYFKPKLSGFKIINDGNRVQVNFSAKEGGTGMFVTRPDGSEARFQLNVSQYPGGVGYSISQVFRQVWLLEFAPAGIGRKEAMHAEQRENAMVKGLTQDMERLKQLGLKGYYTRWGTFVTWEELLEHSKKMAVFQRWAYDRAYLGKKGVPEPEYPYLRGNPDKPTPGS